MLVDPDARYVPSHEWAKKDGPVFAVGLSAYAIVQMGKIIYVELPEVGTVLGQGQKFGTIESLKTAAEMRTPIAGKVVAVNDAVSSNPDTLKKEVYTIGWMIKLEPPDPAQFDGLMDAEAYRKYLESET